MNKFLNFTLILLFVLCSNLTYSSDLDDIFRMKKFNNAIREAESLLKEKKYQEAHTKLEESLKANPDNYNLNITEGKIFEAEGDLISAKENYEKALKLRPYDLYARKCLEELKVTKDGNVKTEHFVFKFVPKSRRYVTILPLEKTYTRVSEFLDAAIKLPIELWVFDNEDQFINEYGQQHTHKKGILKGVSIYAANKILISSTVTQKEMLSVISHEMVHFFLHNKMKDSKLFGIEEGLANFIGERKANYSVLKNSGQFSTEKKEALNFDKLIFYKFTSVHDYQKYTLLYYETSTALIEFINAKAGSKTLKIYINDLMRANNDYYRLLWASLAYQSKEAFEKDFLKFINEGIQKVK